MSDNGTGSDLGGGEAGARAVTETDAAGGEPRSGRPELPRGGRIRRLLFDREAIDLIAETLGVAARLADFQLPGAAVYQLTIPSAHERPATLITLWPSLHRVDAIGGQATVVLTKVATVDLVPDVEVQFRRSTGEYLIVARGGKVIVRA
jgi:hypothetical protein